MKKYHGQLLHSTLDEHGPIEVVDIQQRLRCLHFGNSTQQSAMFLYNPIVLVHKYTQAMLTSLCWQTPQRVLLLGLGAGSIAKFLHHHFHELHIDAVELRPALIDIATEYFSLPEEDERFTIHRCAAEDFIAQHDIEIKYDLILVDLFLTVQSKDINADLTDNIGRMKKMLTSEGLACINVLGTDYKKYSGFQLLQQHFDHNIAVIPVELSNSILLASNTRIPHSESEIDFFAMEKRFGLPFRQYFNKIVYL